MSLDYSPPQKLILTPAQLAYFQDSETYKSIIGYIEILNQAILSCKLTDECPEGEVGGPQLLFQRYTG
jgi:serine/threonine-protein phosphatase 2A activator